MVSVSSLIYRKNRRMVENIFRVVWKYSTLPICFVFYIAFAPCSALTKYIFVIVWKKIPIWLRVRINNVAVFISKPIECLWLLVHGTVANRTPSFIYNTISEGCAIICANIDKVRPLCVQIGIVILGRKRRPSGELDELRIHPRGLYNLGNTCYFNSTMQPLFHTPSFHKVLWRAYPFEKLTASFDNSYKEMQNGSSTPFTPSDVRYEFVKKVSRFDNNRQHDSHECLRHFLDEIRKEERAMKDSSSGNDLLTAVDKVFGGHLVTVYICKECDKHYHLFEPCLDLSLPVFFEAENANLENEMHSKTNTKINEKEEILVDVQYDEDSDKGKDTETDQKKPDISQMNGHNSHHKDEEDDYKRTISKLTKRLSESRKLSRGNMINLEFCLQHFSRVEKIHNEYLCEDCLREAVGKGEADEDNLKLTSATKQTLIFNPPAVLTIHFKRFELLPGGSKKRSDMVEYPEHLDIAPYCSSQCLRNDPPKRNIWYSLYAVVVHSGSLEFGHYFAYVKVRDKGKSITKLKKFLQNVYFNHNITSDELIEMMKKKSVQEPRKAGIQERGESKWLSTQTQQKYLSHKAVSDDLEKMLNKEDEEEFKDVVMSERNDSKWYLLNDSGVREVKVNEVLKQEAYLLFYERTDDTEAADNEKCSSFETQDERDGFNSE